MRLKRILIVYGSSYGQTAKVAERIRESLVQRGFLAACFRGDTLPAGVRFDTFDGIVVAASLIVGGYQKYIQAFVKKHSGELNGVVSAFVAVSGSAGSTKEEERAAAVAHMERFLAATGWAPKLRESVAGAITFTKYNPLLRWWMRRISRAEGASTDTSKDHEYTDWAQVERFAGLFADAVDARVEATEGEPAGHAPAEQHEEAGMAGR